MLNGLIWYGSINNLETTLLNVELLFLLTIKFVIKNVLSFKIVKFFYDDIFNIGTLYLIHFSQQIIQQK